MEKYIGKRPTGTLGEYATMLLFPGARLARKKSHDIRANDTKIEVKSSRERKGGGWIFNIKDHQKRWSPIFVFVCFARGNSWKINKLFFVNKEELLGKRSVWINKDEIGFRFW